ncbi:hypothetical protein BOX15_Mlig029583g3, partial [Macrostomum lignano]
TMQSANLSQMLEEDSGQLQALPLGSASGGSGSGFPVLVAEAIRSAENRGKPCSVRLHRRGWASMVLGRSLYVWRGRQTVAVSGSVTSRPLPLICRELPLCVSDLAHRVELADLLLTPTLTSSGVAVADSSSVAAVDSPAAIAGCLSASPGGLLYYWPSIGQPASYCEHQMQQLRGEQCSQLRHVWGRHCLLSTASGGSLHLVSCRPDSLSCRSLVRSRSYLAGIGRRVSAFVYGSGAGTGGGGGAAGGFGDPAASAPGVGAFRLSVEPLDGGAGGARCSVHLIGTGGQVERWRLDFCGGGSGGGQPPTETHLGSLPVARLVASELASSRQLACSSVHLLDLEITQDTNHLWVACSASIGSGNDSGNNAIVCVQVDPSSGALTHLLLLGDQLLSDIDQQLPCLRATDQLLASPVLLLCAPTALLAIDGFTGQLHAKLMLSQTGDRLLGVGCLPGEGTYFCTRRQGVAVLQAISHQHHAHQQTAGLQSASANMSLAAAAAATASSSSSRQQQQPHQKRHQQQQQQSDPKNPRALLAAAFRAYFVSGGARQDRQSVDSLTSLFASAVAASSDAQLEESRHELAAALLSFGAYLLNRPPTADPRWPADPDADSDNSSSAVDDFRLCQIASNSVIIERVLDDKRQWINQYLRFLNESGLLACPPPGLRLADLHDLAEMALAARAVRCAQLLRTGGGGSGNTGSLFDSLIGRVVGDRLATSSVGVQPGAMALTASDLFYREVSRIPDLFPALAQQLEQARQSADRTARELNSFFLDAGALMAGLARDLLSYRRSTDRLGGEGRVKQQQQQQQSRWLDYDRSGQWLHGIANQLIGHLGQSVSEARVRAELLSDTADCLDLVLASLSGGDQFEAVRRELLFALWEKCDAPDRAVALAERYREFDLLIRVCESLPDSQEQQQMLSRYQAQLSGFSTHLAAYYLRTGKRGCLLRMTALQQQNQQSQQQQHHHPETQPLAWLQEVASGQFGRAGATLSALARSEKRLASRKRSLLSMAKLAYLASGGGAAEALRAANCGLELLDYQDCLPEEAISDAEDGEDATGNIEADSSKRSKPGNQQHRRQRYTRVYTAAELIDKFTSHAANSFADQSELEFKRALDLLAYLTESDDREALRALVWARALLTDWTRTQQESQQQHGGDASVSMTGDIMAGSVFIRTAELLCSDLIDGRELNLARPPTVNQLLQCPAVPPELRSNPQFEYHVKVLHERAAPLLVP